MQRNNVLKLIDDILEHEIGMHYPNSLSDDIVSALESIGIVVWSDLERANENETVN